MSEQIDTPKENVDKKTIDKKETYYDQRSVALRTTQSICFVKEHDKTTMLGLLLNDYKETQVVIVVKSKKKADALSKFLSSKEFTATAVHGNHREAQQQEAASKFNAGTLHILITTDMILKTLMLENIKLVLSHDLPDVVQDYYNRLALMKEQGVGIALVNHEDELSLVDIEYNMKAEIQEQFVKDFVETSTPNHSKIKKNRSKKPRHRKNNGRKDQDMESSRE